MVVWLFCCIEACDGEPFSDCMYCYITECNGHDPFFCGYSNCYVNIMPGKCIFLRADTRGGVTPFVW